MLTFNVLHKWLKLDQNVVLFLEITLFWISSQKTPAIVMTLPYPKKNFARAASERSCAPKVWRGWRLKLRGRDLTPKLEILKHLHMVKVTGWNVILGRGTSQVVSPSKTHYDWLIGRLSSVSLEAMVKNVRSWMILLEYKFCFKWQRNQNTGTGNP